MGLGAADDPAGSFRVRQEEAAVLGSSSESSGEEYYRANKGIIAPPTDHQRHTPIVYSPTTFFTSLHAIASTGREAELIAQSFATMGYNVLPADVVSTDPSEWGALVRGWMDPTVFRHVHSVAPTALFRPAPTAASGTTPLSSWRLPITRVSLFKQS